MKAAEEVQVNNNVCKLRGEGSRSSVLIRWKTSLSGIADLLAILIRKHSSANHNVTKDYHAAAD